MNRKMIIYTLGRMLISEGLLLLLPAITGLIYKEILVSLSFLFVAIFAALIGDSCIYKIPRNFKIYSI